MKNLLTLSGVFVLGWFTGMVMVSQDVENGDVVVENDDMYVTAAKSKSHGWSHARVNYKKPQ